MTPARSGANTAKKRCFTLPKRKRNELKGTFLANTAAKARNMNKTKMDVAIAKIKSLKLCDNCQTKILVCISMANAINNFLKKKKVRKYGN